MPTIERYHATPGVEARVCELIDPSDRSSRHSAELILRDGQKDQYLCKAHAAISLSGNKDLLAKAVIELYLPDVGNSTSLP
jgi:hypothetical protein